MSWKDEAVKAVDNAGDALNEGRHRAEAEAERSRRELAGDEMTADEKAGSVLNEAKNDVQAGIDHAKRDVRNG